MARAGYWTGCVLGIVNAVALITGSEGEYWQRAISGCALGLLLMTSRKP